jgi:hypothetical protein
MKNFSSKKPIKALATIIAAVLFVAMFGMITTQTQATGAGAVVIKDDGCAMVDENGDVTVFSSSNVRVQNSKGNALIQCKAFTPNTTGAAIHWNFDNTGFLCLTNAGFTEKWQQTISDEGDASLICHFKP